MITIKQYLTQNGYSSVEDWAIDSDFTLGADNQWRNDEGHVTNIVDYLHALLAEGHYS